jgi:hypothetical protein
MVREKARPGLPENGNKRKISLRFLHKKGDGKCTLQPKLKKHQNPC